MSRQKTLYTLGHSTRPLEEFLAIVRRYEIQQVIDVRTVPRSRHNPQYNQDTFSSAFCKEGIVYIHMKSLGGLRKPREDSINQGLQNESFRGFADYMQTEEFEENIRHLIKYRQNKRSLIICAEALPEKCHRSLISDAMVVRGIPVEHILTMGKTVTHALSAQAVVNGFTIVYR